MSPSPCIVASVSRVFLGFYNMRIIARSLTTVGYHGSMSEVDVQ